MSNELIAPERHGMFITASFIIAVVALVLSLFGTYRSHGAIVTTQMEILVLNKKIKRLEARAEGAESGTRSSARGRQDSGE